jgi:hypothetical protein
MTGIYAQRRSYRIECRRTGRRTVQTKVVFCELLEVGPTWSNVSTLDLQSLWANRDPMFTSVASYSGDLTRSGRRDNFSEGLNKAIGNEKSREWVFAAA